MPKSILYLLLVILLVFLGIGGFFGYKLITQKNTTNFSAKSDLLGNPFFEYQQAMVIGQITSTEGQFLFIKNNKGITGKVEASKSVAIYLLGKDGLPSITPTSDINQIKLNQEVTILAKASGGSYQAVSISYPSKNALTPSTKPPTLELATPPFAPNLPGPESSPSAAIVKKQ